MQAAGKKGDIFMAEYEHVTHDFEPVYDEYSKVLILGTLPSVKSREAQFYYGHPQNRFWKVLGALFEENVPETIDEKKALLLAHRVAIWDVVESCDIIGSSDSSIRNVTAADVAGLLQKTRIEKVYANGGLAKKLYDKFLFEKTGVTAVKLPSTSPANARFSLEDLIEEWIQILP